MATEVPLRRRPEQDGSVRRILVMTVVHNPADSRIWHRQISALLASGWHVTYAAPFSGYGQQPHTRDPRLPGSLSCLDIRRAAGRHRALANHEARQVLKRLARSHDLVLIHDPELLAAAAGLGLRHLVWDVHEDLAAALQVKQWVPTHLRPVLATTWRLLERQVERSHELLLAESEYQRRFRRNHPVVPNAVTVPPKTARPGTNRVVYLGTVTEARGCSLMIDVARSLSQLPGPPVQLEVIGDAPEKRCADALRRADRDGTLSWQGFLPSPSALSRLSGALAGLSLLDDLPNFRCSLPTKVIEYAAVGVPVITTPLPIAIGIVREANCGVVVPWRDPGAVVDAIAALRDDPGRAAMLGHNGHLTALKHYDWQTLSHKFVEHMALLAEAIATRSAGTRAAAPWPAEASMS